MSADPPVFAAVLAAVFWCSVLGVLYTYLGYPALIYVLARLAGRRATAVPEDASPTVALIIAAHNEADVIEQRIHNALSLQYPALQIVIASDGSTDATAAICERYRGRVVPLLFPERRGKAATLNAAVEQVDAEILVLSDANTWMEPQAVRKLVRWFNDPAVGAVSGRLILTDPATGHNADSLYWRYENFLKECEGILGGPLGANGAIYAIRRSLFSPLPRGTVVDDFIIPLRARLRSGCRIAYDPAAIAREETAPGLAAEFRRRTRIGVGAWQALVMLWPLLSPRFGWTALALWSHKVLRWACPFLLLGALLSSITLAAEPLFALAAVIQALFYVACLAGATGLGRRARLLRLCSLFAAMNLALLVGFFRWLRGGHAGTWTTTPRSNSGQLTAAA